MYLEVDGTPKWVIRHLDVVYLTGRVVCTGFPSNPVPQPHQMDSAVSFLKLGVRLAGSLCGVPGVSVLADAVVVLIETCENIPKQR